MKIDMSAAKRDPRPIIPFGLSAFAASLFALGLALGTTIAVGMLFIIQVSVRLLLQKSQKLQILPDCGAETEIRIETGTVVRIYAVVKFFRVLCCLLPVPLL